MALVGTLKSCADEDFERGVHTDLAKCVAIAMRRMGEKAGPAVPLLIEILNSPSMQKRQAAAIALGGVGPKAAGATAALIRAQNDDSIEVRLEAVRALARIGPGANAAVPVLLAASGKTDRPDTKSRVSRELSAIALIAIDPSKGRNVIERMIAESAPPDFMTRAFLYNTLGRRSLETDWYMRLQERWLRELNKNSLNPAIFPKDRYHVSPPSGDSVEGTINILARFGPRASVAAPQLRDLCRHPDPFYRQTAQAALREITGEGIGASDK